MMIKKILVIFLFCSFSFCDSLKISLVDLVNFLNSDKEKIFIFNDKLADENIYFSFSKKLNSLSINDIKKVLKLRKLYIYNFNNYYYIDYLKNYDDEYKLFSYNLKYNSYNSVKKIIELYFENNSEEKKEGSKKRIVDFLENTNTILFICKENDYQFLKKIISDNDKNTFSRSLKIVIFETNNDKVKSVGTRYQNFLKVYDKNDLQSFLNIFSLSSSSTIVNNNNSFYNFLNFLSEKKISKIISSPTLLLKSNSHNYFSIVENVAYLTKSEEFESSNKTTSNTFLYKDVGLKIDILPFFYKNDDFLDIELKIDIEDILDNSLTPKTSKKSISGFYTLKKNEVLFISGFEKESFFKDTICIPLLCKIPFIKYLFKYDFRKKINSSLFISLELI